MTGENPWPAFCATLRLDDLEREDLPPTRKRRQRRKPTLARMIKQARKLGVDVMVGTDGSMTLRTSVPHGDHVTESGGNGSSSENPWDEVLPNAAN
jgi:hypothetical protein